MGKHVKKKRLSIERVVETVSPDVVKEKENRDKEIKRETDKEESTCCNCFKFINVEKPTTINGNNNVVDKNMEATVSVGLNKK